MITWLNVVGLGQGRGRVMEGAGHRESELIARDCALVDFPVIQEPVGKKFLPNHHAAQ